MSKEAIEKAGLSKAQKAELYALKMLADTDDFRKQKGQGKAMNADIDGKVQANEKDSQTLEPMVLTKRLRVDIHRRQGGKRQKGNIDLTRKSAMESYLPMSD